MRYTLTNLGRNLWAGLRLALFLPVSRLAFRIDLPQLLLLFLLSAALDVARDGWHAGADALFSWSGAVQEFYFAGLLLFLAAVLAIAWRQRAFALGLSVLALAVSPVILVIYEIPGVLRAFGMPGYPVRVLGLIAALWAVLVLVRCVAVARAPSQLRRPLSTFAGGALFAIPIWVPVLLGADLAPDAPWFREARDPTVVAGLNAGSEPVLAAQSFLLDDQLGKIADERPGVTDLYFVGFAPYGAEDVFRKDVEAAKQVMDERWGTAGRSILLVNNPQTLLTTPFATLTNLRETLNEIGGAIDADNDVVMVYLASHGSSDFRLAAMQPPLTLVEVTPKGLRQLLDDAGIQWRIVVVSACFAGGFIAPLQDEKTLVIAAAQSDRISFGCGNRSESTFFGEAFFQRGLATADSFPAAFEIAKARVAERETGEGYAPPSNPQLWMGEAMKDKLESLRNRGAKSGVTAGVAVPPAESSGGSARWLRAAAAGMPAPAGAGLTVPGRNVSIARARAPRTRSAPISGPSSRAFQPVRWNPWRTR